MMHLIITLNLCLANAQENRLDKLQNKEWEAVFGDNKYSYLKSAAIADPKDGSIYISGHYLLAEQIVPPVVEGLWIWKINSKGEKVIDVRIVNKDEKKYNRVQSLAIAEDNNIVLVAETDNGIAELLRVRSDGIVLSIKKMSAGFHIKKILSIDKALLLIGSKYNSSLIRKVDLNGENVWEKVDNKNLRSMFVDGISTPDNGFFLIQNSGENVVSKLSYSEFRIGKYDSEGNEIAGKSFPGQCKSLSHGNGVSYAIVYDNIDAVEQSVRVMVFDINLKEKWTATVDSDKKGLVFIKIAALRNGGYIVVGQKVIYAWVSYIDDAGIKKWNFYNQALEPSPSIDLVSDGKNCFLISSVSSVNEHDKAIKNKVVKFIP